MKSNRVQHLLQGIPPGPGELRLQAFFHHFNAGRYYEAHDVLESLWLEQGTTHPDHAFHKGWIQLAGGFVHLRLQRLYPHHHAHGRRLGPALRLLDLAARNLAAYPDHHHGTALSAARALISQTAQALRTHPHLNPWNPLAPPFLPPPSVKDLS